MAGFLSRLVTKICRVLTTRKTVDDDEVAPRRNKVRTFKVLDQNLLTTRTMDDEDAPGLKAVPNFQVPDEVEPEDVIDPAEMNTLESRLGSLIQHDTITRVPAFKDIHGLALAIVLERLNSHGAFPEVHDKTRATGTVPTVKSTSKIEKCTGYGSKPESYVSSCVEGMEVVCKEFETTSKVPQGHSVDDLITEFHSCLAVKVSKTFDIRLMGASSKSCEYVLSTLMQVFEDKWFAHAVKERTLDNLITEILIWLPDERVPRMHDGSQLLKVLNVLMLKILDNAKRTSSFVVLISLLVPLHPSRWPSPPSNESFATRNMKFSNLVVKCLIKLTKDLQSTIDEVNLDHILQIIHVYLQELGIDEIRRRVGARENDVHMLKTLLYELCKLCGTAIKGHLSMVPIDMEPQPIILAYIDLNLQTLAAARLLTPTRPTGQTQWGDSMGNNPMPAAHCAGAQLKFVSFLYFKRGVSAKGSKAESIMSVQDKSGPVGSRLAFTPTEPQRERHPMPQPSVIGPTNWNEATPTLSHGFRTFTSVEGMKVICQEFEAISKDLEVHLVDDLITDADRLVSCLVAKVLQMYRLLLLKYLLVMAWRSTILILLLEFIHSTLKKGFNHVEARGFEFLAPTTRRNSMRVLQAMQLKKPVLLEASPCVGKTSLVLALGKFSGHSGLQINFSEQVIAEYFKRRISWPKTNV
ncbi:hypothetical protein Tco_0794235 [Tanacetum coccineum]